MRVALCISGLPRSVKRCHGNINEVFISPFNPDIFTYFWKANIETRESSPNLDFRHEITQAHVRYPAVTNVVIEPSTSLLQEYFKENNFNVADMMSVLRDKRRHCLSMYKAIYEVNRLKTRHEIQNQFKYDLVMRIRTDVSFRGFTSRNLPILEGYISIPQRKKLVAGGYGDEFAWGPSEAMDYYSSLYLHFREYQQALGDKRNNDGWWNPHQMLKLHLDKGPWPVNIIPNCDLRKRIHR
jgi:hypothetical protein